MKLNLDCVRDILLCVEENTGVRKYCYFVDSTLDDFNHRGGFEVLDAPDYQKKLMENGSVEELIYHINYCVKADLLSQINSSTGYKILIADLTPKGHDFLENIREKTIWDGVKAIATKVGSKSLESVTQIASNVVIEIIRAQLKKSNILPFI